MLRIVLYCIVCSAITAEGLHTVKVIKDSTGKRCKQSILYGDNEDQTMDIHFPCKKINNPSPVFFVVHEDGWIKGSKENMTHIVNYLLKEYPDHVTANINYRLGTLESPGYPKQWEDVQFAVNFLKKNKKRYNLIPKFAMIGRHISMLHAYKFDTTMEVKVVVNIGGLSDLTDPNILEEDAVHTALTHLFYKADSPKIPQDDFSILSCINYITSDSPPTVSFYGEIDNTVPLTQPKLLKKALDAAGVYGKYYIYPRENHYFQQRKTWNDVFKIMSGFFKQFFLN